MTTQLEAVKAIHDAALALGASCNDSCPMWEPFAYDYKSHKTLDRDRALTFLHELGRAIHPG